MYQGYEDLRGHGGARVYRRYAIVETGCNTGCGTGQAWTGCCMQMMPGLEYMIHVYECGCKDLGEDG